MVYYGHRARIARRLARCGWSSRMKAMFAKKARSAGDSPAKTFCFDREPGTKNRELISRGVDMIEDNGLRISFKRRSRNDARIKVIGVGGGGNNAVNRMIDSGMENIEIHRREYRSASPTYVARRHQNSVGREAYQRAGRGLRTLKSAAKLALEDSDKIIEASKAPTLIFVTAGLGGGTALAPLRSLRRLRARWARSRWRSSRSRLLLKANAHAAGRTRHFGN